MKRTETNIIKDPSSSREKGMNASSSIVATPNISPEMVAHVDCGCTNVNVAIIKVAKNPTVPNKRPIPEIKRVVAGIFIISPTMIKYVAVSTFFFLLKRIARIFRKDDMAPITENKIAVSLWFVPDTMWRRSLLKTLL